MMPLERNYQAKLRKKIQDILDPDCYVLKTDPSVYQGFPDLLILKGKYWVALEVKINRVANLQPNQEYYVDKLNSFGFCRFIYPEIEDQVIGEIIEYLEVF